MEFRDLLTVGGFACVGSQASQRVVFRLRFISVDFKYIGMVYSLLEAGQAKEYGSD